MHYTLYRDAIIQLLELADKALNFYDDGTVNEKPYSTSIFSILLPLKMTPIHFFCIFGCVKPYLICKQINKKGVELHWEESATNGATQSSFL